MSQQFYTDPKTLLNTCKSPFSVRDRVCHINEYVRWKAGTVLETSETDCWRCVPNMVLVLPDGDEQPRTFPVNVLKLNELDDEDW